MKVFTGNLCPIWTWEGNSTIPNKGTLEPRLSLIDLIGVDGNRIAKKVR